MSYEDGYSVGYANGRESSALCVGSDYVPTAAERARSINFQGGDPARRDGWLAGWTSAVEPFREFQERELRVTTAAGWVTRHYQRWS